MTALHHDQPSLHDVAHQLAPHLRIVSSSQPVPTLRAHNVIALTDSARLARAAVLALEGLEHDDDELGTVVMSHERRPDPMARAGADPEGVARVVIPRVVIGALLGAVIGFVVVGGAALLFGATGWRVGGAGVGGLMMFSILGALWVTFAGLGGSDAYRQTFVDEAVTDLTIVSLHTDDDSEADAAHRALENTEHLTVFDIDQDGNHLETRRPTAFPRPYKRR